MLLPIASCVAPRSESCRATRCCNNAITSSSLAATIVSLSLFILIPLLDVLHQPSNSVDIDANRLPNLMLSQPSNAELNDQDVLKETLGSNLQLLPLCHLLVSLLTFPNSDQLLTDVSVSAPEN